MVIVAIGGIVAGGFSATVLSKNFSLIVPFAKQFLALKSPKGVMVERVFGPMISEKPYIPIVGVGPGQFTSTGALIATGQYFGGPLHPQSLPFLRKHLTPIQRKYFYDQWVRQDSNRYYGSTQAPFFSVLSIFVAFGGVVLLALLGIFVRPVFNAWHGVRQKRLPFMIGFATVGTSLFMIFLGFQVNYWSVPQASFLGFFNLSLLASYSAARRSRSASGGTLR